MGAMASRCPRSSIIWECAMTSSSLQQQLSLRHNVQGTVYVLHFDPPYEHAQHYVGRTQGDVAARVRCSCGAMLAAGRAAVAAGVDVQLSATYEGTRYLERRMPLPCGSSPSASSTHGRSGTRRLERSVFG
jgi:hypothetical protein